MSEPTRYELLGVARTATDDELKSAWRAAAREHHPDLGGDAEEFRRRRDAFEYLSDPERRASYDQHLDWLEQRARASAGAGRTARAGTSSRSSGGGTGRPSSDASGIGSRPRRAPGTPRRRPTVVRWIGGALVRLVFRLLLVLFLVVGGAPLVWAAAQAAVSVAVAAAPSLVLLLVVLWALSD